jgi:hypothetical protein
MVRHVHVAARTRYPGFTSFKSEAPIHYPRRWHRDALIQAALDPTISSLRPTPFPLADLPTPAEFAFLAVVGGVTFLTVVTNGDRVIQTVSDWSGPLSIVQRFELLARARFTAARNVWSRKRLAVNPVDRFLAIQRCRERTPDATVTDVMPALRSSFSDPIDQVLAMLAQGYLVADLTNGLTPDTVLRVGPMAMTPSRQRPVIRLKSLEHYRSLMESP